MRQMMLFTASASHYSFSHSLGLYMCEIYKDRIFVYFRIHFSPVLWHFKTDGSQSEALSWPTFMSRADIRHQIMIMHYIVHASMQAQSDRQIVS
jgi:hypothetical protein